MKIQAWPFLVSRNRSLGYRTVVAPGFVVDANIASLLATRLGGELNNEPQVVELPATKAGTLGVVYHIVRATNGDTAFRDESGRPILWIEGIVLREPPHQLSYGRNVLQEAHRRVAPDYLAFWEQSSDGPVRRSEPFSLVVDADGVAGASNHGSGAAYGPPVTAPKPLPAHTAQTATRSVQPWYVAAGLAGLLIVSLAWGGWMFRQNRALNTEVLDLTGNIGQLCAQIKQPQATLCPTATPVAPTPTP